MRRRSFLCLSLDLPVPTHYLPACSLHPCPWLVRSGLTRPGRADAEQSRAANVRDARGESGDKTCDINCCPRRVCSSRSLPECMPFADRHGDCPTRQHPCTRPASCPFQNSNILRCYCIFQNSNMEVLHFNLSFYRKKTFPIFISTFHKDKITKMSL